MPRISIEEINELCERSLPWVGMLGFEVAEIGPGTCRVRLPPRAEFLRPGGTVSGPALMSLRIMACTWRCSRPLARSRWR